VRARRAKLEEENLAKAMAASMTTSACESEIESITSAIMQRLAAFGGPDCGVTATDSTQLLAPGERKRLCSASCRINALLRAAPPSFAEAEELCTDDTSRNAIQAATSRALAFHDELMAVWSDCSEAIELAPAQAVPERAPIAAPTPPGSMVKQSHLAARFVKIFNSKGKKQWLLDCKELISTFAMFDQQRSGRLTSGMVGPVLHKLREDQMHEAKEALANMQKKAKNPGFVTFEDIVVNTFGVNEEVACRMEKRTMDAIAER